jgi:predicted Rossmann-fold nucleotide-binding protein
MKVLVIGGIYDSGIEQIAKETGKVIAKKNYALVTGGSIGSPHNAALGASKIKGNKIITFSPDSDKTKHIQNPLNCPLELYTEIHYHDGRLNFKEHGFLALRERETYMISYSDIGIMLGGNSGALDELYGMTRAGKFVGILINTGHFSKKVYDLRNSGIFLTKNIIFDTEPSRLLDSLVEKYNQ